jgi:DNA-binding transcriptional ArsR family regulator
MSGHIDEMAAVAAFAALAQPTRMAAFRHLVRCYPDTVAAGDLARACATPHNTMSAHLGVLARAGLIGVRREGRSMQYAADVDGLRAVVRFLMSDCCGGRTDICAPLIAELSLCSPEEKVCG